jgi:hypothetical protein
MPAGRFRPQAAEAPTEVPKVPYWALFDGLPILEEAARGTVGAEAAAPEDGSCPLLEGAWRIRAAHVRANPTRADGIDENVSRLKFLGKKLCEAIQGGLARTIAPRRVVAEVLHVAEGVDLRPKSGEQPWVLVRTPSQSAGDQHDPGTIKKQWGESAGQEERSADVDVPDGPIVDASVDASIVDQDFQLLAAPE